MLTTSGYNGIIVSNDTLFGEKMNLSEFFKDTFLFSGIEIETITELISGSVIEKHFKRGELIYSCECYENMVGFVESGECEVNSQNSRVPLNTLKPPASFGITSVFTTRSDFPTNIYAKHNSTVLFIDKNDLFKMMQLCPKISKNIISFLVERIEFLNTKISTFSSENVESKLSHYLLCKYRIFGEEFEINLSHAAEEINAGRASLYRALSSLECDGLISRDGKKIVVNNPKGLERK